MTGKEIVDIIAAIGFFGWIPIYFFFNGIAKVIGVIKGNKLNDNGGISINISHDDEEDDNCDDSDEEF